MQRYLASLVLLGLVSKTIVEGRRLHADVLTGATQALGGDAGTVLSNTADGVNQLATDTTDAATTNVKTSLADTTKRNDASKNTVGFVDSTLANTFGRRLHADVLTGATQALGGDAGTVLSNTADGVNQLATDTTDAATTNVKTSLADTTKRNDASKNTVAFVDKTIGLGRRL